jgi:hypothetical protein
MKDMILTLHGTATQQAKLQRLVDDLHNPNSPAFHNWLTPAAFGAQFRPAEEDVNTVTAWLANNGFKVEQVSAAKSWIRFSGTAQQVEQAFSTQIHRYEVKGVTHYANATELSLPTALTPAVSGVVSMNNFLKHAQHVPPATVTRNANGKLVRIPGNAAPPQTPGIDPALAAGPGYTSTGSQEENYLAPGDWAKLYNTTTLTQAGNDGKGVSIAIVGRSDISLSDVEAFRTIFKLPLHYPKITYATTDPGVIPGDDEEAILDVEWSGAVAPAADINLVIGASTLTTDGVDISASYIVDHALAPIMSVSFGECEAELSSSELTFFNDLWQQAAAEGISVMVSSGDGGASDCVVPSEYRATPYGFGVNGLASTPYNVAVGGTELNDIDTNHYWNIPNSGDLSSIKGYVPETVWNESCNESIPSTTTNCYYPGYESTYAGGGGASSCALRNVDEYGDVTCIGGYAKPSWQNARGVPKDHVRDLPDVALAAAASHDGFLLCYNGSCQWTRNPDGSITLTQASVIGGTSAASPSFAGIMALVEQKVGAYQGQPNYQLYRIAAEHASSSCTSLTETDPARLTSCVFHDVSLGTNALSCDFGATDCTVPIAGSPRFGELSGHNARIGYDLATGLGSVDAANLVKAWGSIRLLPSTASLILSQTNFVHGTPVNVAANVTATDGTGTPSGSIVLTSNHGNSLDPGTLTSGAYTGVINNLPGGTYQVSAQYGGDAIFSSSTSNSVTVTVSPQTSTAVGSTYALSPFFIHGQQLVEQLSQTQLGNPFFVQFQIGPAGVGIPTGTITLKHESNIIGAFPLDDTGKIYVQCGPSTNCDYGLGTYTFVASYSGDASFAPSIATVPFTVYRGPINYYVNLNNQTPPAGSEVIATVSFENDPAVPPTGTVTLTRQDTGATLATGTINKSGTAIIPFAAPAGSYNVLASWPGDSNYIAGALIEYPQLITTSAGAAPSRTTLSANGNQIPMGQQTQFTVAASAIGKGQSVPTGTVTLYSAEGQLAAPFTLIGGQATGFVQWGHVAVENVYAVYSGDTNFAASNSGSYTVTVTRATPHLVLTANPTSVPSGSQSLLNAYLTSALSATNVLAPTGSIQFYDSVNGSVPQPIGTPQALNTGNGGSLLATLAPTLPEGQNTLTAKYSGDANWNAISSEPVLLVVTK